MNPLTGKIALVTGEAEAPDEELRWSWRKPGRRCMSPGEVSEENLRKTIREQLTTLQQKFNPMEEPHLPFVATTQTTKKQKLSLTASNRSKDDWTSW